MKKYISLLLCLLLVFGLVGCSEKNNEESTNSNDKNKDTTSSEVKTNEESKIIKGHANLDNIYEFIDLCDYDSIKIDWSQGAPNQIMNSYLSKNCTPNEKEITDRPIQSGDVANIDFVGKKDGVAFEGGTSSGYDLAIGSNSFIDGFEDGLIGVSIGETVDLNLTFSENYSSAELAGADVVFTVTVNSITQKEYKDEDIDKAKEASKFDAMLMEIVENSKFKALPEDDIESYKAQYVNSYGEETGTQYAKETVKQLLVIFALSKSEGITVSTDEYNDQMKEVTGQYNVSQEEIEDLYGKSYIELCVLLKKLENIF